MSLVGVAEGVGAGDEVIAGVVVIGGETVRLTLPGGEGATLEESEPVLVVEPAGASTASSRAIIIGIIMVALAVVRSDWPRLKCKRLGDGARAASIQ